MDIALDFESKGCGFDPRRGLFFPLTCPGGVTHVEKQKPQKPQNVPPKSFRGGGGGGSFEFPVKKKTRRKRNPGPRVSSRVSPSQSLRVYPSRLITPFGYTPEILWFSSSPKQPSATKQKKSKQKQKNERVCAGALWRIPRLFWERGAPFPFWVSLTGRRWCKRCKKASLV